MAGLETGIKLGTFKALPSIRRGMLRHEGSFIVTQDSTGQDSTSDPLADKSHAGIWFLGAVGGRRDKLQEHGLSFRSVPMAGLHRAGQAGSC